MSEIAQSTHDEHIELQWLIGLEIVAASLAVIFAVAVGVPVPIVVSVIAIVVFLLAVFRVNALLYASVFFLPIEPVLPTGFMIHDVSAILHITMFLGLCAGALMDDAPFRQRFLRGRLTYLATAFGLVSLCSVVVFNQASEPAQSALLRLLSYLCVYFTIVGWLESEEQVRTIILFLLLSTIVVALFGLYQLAISSMSDLYFWIYPKQTEDDIVIWTGRITSFLNYYNSLAGYLNLVLPFALVCTVVPTTRTLRLVALSCLSVGTVALVLTQSRGGVFAFGGTLLLAILLLFRKSNRKGLALSLILLMSIALPVLVGLSTRFATIEDESGLMRYVLWGAAGIMFLSSPLVGIGYGNFRNLYNLPGFQSGVFDVHNLYLQLLTETGVIGFVVFIWLVVVALRMAWRQFHQRDYPADRIVGFAAFAAILTVLIHGFVDYLFIVSPQFGALFWMILGILAAREHFRQDPRHGHIEGV